MKRFTYMFFGIAAVTLIVVASRAEWVHQSSARTPASPPTSGERRGQSALHQLATSGQELVDPDRLVDRLEAACRESDDRAASAIASQILSSGTPGHVACLRALGRVERYHLMGPDTLALSFGVAIYGILRTGAKSGIGSIGLPDGFVYTDKARQLIKSNQREFDNGDSRTAEELARLVSTTYSEDELPRLISRVLETYAVLKLHGTKKAVLHLLILLRTPEAVEALAQLLATEEDPALVDLLAIALAEPGNTAVAAEILRSIERDAKGGRLAWLGTRLEALLKTMRFCDALPFLQNLCDAAGNKHTVDVLLGMAVGHLLSKGVIKSEDMAMLLSALYTETRPTHIKFMLEACERHDNARAEVDFLSKHHLLLATDAYVARSALENLSHSLGDTDFVPLFKTAAEMWKTRPDLLAGALTLFVVRNPTSTSALDLMREFASSPDVRTRLAYAKELDTVKLSNGKRNPFEAFLRTRLLEEQDSNVRAVLQSALDNCHNVVEAK